MRIVAGSFTGDSRGGVGTVKSRLFLELKAESRTTFLYSEPRQVVEPDEEVVVVDDAATKSYDPLN